MSATTITVLALLFPLAVMAVAALLARLVMKKTGNIKRSFKVNFATIGIMMLLFVMFGFTASAAGTDQAAVELAKAATINGGLGLIAAGLCTGLAGIGGGLALASGVPAAIGAVSEDPKAFGKALIFVALGETIALYGVIISILILQKC
ncbi:MAG: ATP synthase subunit C [Acutalibacteraceae bacterium]